jgi:tetratricopeptide (TPR) repeat protein
VRSRVARAAAIFAVTVLAARVQATPRAPKQVAHPDAPSEVPMVTTGSAQAEAGSGAGSAGSAVPVAGPPVEVAGDVPAMAPSPPRFAVAPFLNQTTSKNLDWIMAGAPFEIDDKTEGVLGLAPTGGPRVVGLPFDTEDPGQVAAFARARGAAFVITGWASHPGENLRLSITIWKPQPPGSDVPAIVVGEGKRTGPVASYHQMLGEALAAAWTAAGVPVDPPHLDRLVRPLSPNLYPVELMGRGLGYLTGAIDGKVDLKLAEHDLERAVFIDPKMSEGQRLVGELYLAEGDARKAAAKFSYANDLAPDDLGALRGAAFAAAQATKHDLALELYGKLVKRQPWDVEARFQLGAALWGTGDGTAAAKQLEQVTAANPDHLAARHVLVLIHASQNNTPKLIDELEAIAIRAPNDLDVKADLASAYGAVGRWSDAAAQLEAIVASEAGPGALPGARAPDLALLVRIGDARRRGGDLQAAMTWYGKASQLAPWSSLPGFATAQALFDAGRLAEANRVYTNLQKYAADLPAAEEALGAIALAQHRPDDAAWYLRRAAREAPRSLVTRRALIAAELARHDHDTALQQLEPALAAWPSDGALHYLAGVAHAMAGEREPARAELAEAGRAGYAPARAAIDLLDTTGSVAPRFAPELVRPWGDADTIAAALDRYAATAAAMATERAAYQTSMLGTLGQVGVGPKARAWPGGLHGCPLAEVAPTWAAGQQQLARYLRLGVDLEADARFVLRADDAGQTAALLPNQRLAVAALKKSFRVALADAGELREEWTRGLEPELRVVGCTDRLLAAAAADPTHYKVITEDAPEALPQQAPPRARPRVTFYVDNTRCPDPVTVWIDGAQLGEVAPGRRSALVSDGGDRTLCLLGAGAAECGDRGTLRQVYLHDGWSVTMHCPK